MARRNEKRENITLICPSCGQKYTVPLTAALPTKCQNCGKVFYTTGVEIENPESRKLQDEIRTRRRRETEADKEHE